MSNTAKKPNDSVKEDYDLIVIGSGCAGLTCAIQARELGLKPVILEKMETFGGNSMRASSGMNASETIVQLKHGMKKRTRAEESSTIRSFWNILHRTVRLRLTGLLLTASYWTI